MAKCCYIPTKGVDDVIAAKLGWTPSDKQKGFNPYRVATLRGMYDEVHPNTPLSTDNLEEATQKLIKFRRDIARTNAASVTSAGSNLSKSYQNLRKALTAEERFNRTNMIATMFSTVVDDIQKANPSLSRNAIIQGFTTQDGRKVLGEFAIFDKVYDYLLDKQAAAMATNTPESINKAHSIHLVLENWSSLVPFVRMKLRDTEGVKLGNNLEYSDTTNPDNYEDNKLSELFDASESTREAWQEMNDAHSAFGSIGQQVRRLLGSLPKYDIVTKTDASGKTFQAVEIVRDDLGFPIMLDPVKIHQSLSELLRGVQSESHLLGVLRRAQYGDKGEVILSQKAWLAPIVVALENNPQLKTQFFVDFKKNFQPYSILIEDVKKSKGGIKYYKTKILNRIENLLKGGFMTRISLGEQVNEVNSIYNKDGSINWKNLQDARNYISEWLNPKEALAVRKYFDPKVSQIQRREFLRQASEMLGIEVDAETLDKIIKNNKDLQEYLKNLKEAITYGIDFFLNNSEKEALDKGNYSQLPNMQYKTLLNKKQKSGDTKGSLKEKIDKILTLIVKHREGLKLESKVRHKDRKGNSISLFSNVNPSYLGDKIDRIQSYVAANDKAGLRTYITNEYLNSSFFKDTDGTIYNKWIQELLNCCDPKGPELAETFAAKFTYQRFLGTTDNSFENFTSKQHAIDMLTEFFSDRQISGKNINHISLDNFNSIKGDKTKVKAFDYYYIKGTDKAFRYRKIDSKGNPIWEESVKDDTALYPIFILGDSGVSKYIRAPRYDSQTILEGLYNVYRQEKRRQALVKASNEFLKSQGYTTIDNFSKTSDTYTALQFLNEEAYSLSENPTEEEVKKVISTYMSDAVEKFKQDLNNLGLLETKEIRDNQGNKSLKYVYLNQNATPQNINEVLADYYWNTKFATIQQLQLMTTDPAFYKGTKDLQKRYKEIHAPGSVLSLQARNPYSAEHEKFSEDGIERCVYFEDISLNAEETNKEFMDVIASRFGKDSKVYNTYKDNTLTDGQGYRSLDSYRKVLGMAGQWTSEMEETYKAIKSLRAKYSRQDQIPLNELADIAARAVVFQPIKPYMFTHEKLALNNEDCVLIPVQHKYAEAVLIPELLPYGSKLADIAYYMEDNNIDLVGSTKIVKVGGFGAANIKNVTNAEDLNTALSKAYVHQLPYSDYRIQTNVPEHINSSQLFGTQVRKLIMANIKMNDYHYSNYVNGNTVNLGGNHGTVKLNGRNLVSFYNSLIVANILESFNKFNDNVSNTNKLSERLLQTTINNSRESMDNILAYALTDDEQFAMPLFEGALEHDSATLLFSIFKKMVNKQSIKGGSAVQVSAMGINSYEEDGNLKYVTDGKNNILYAEVEMPWDISYTDTKGNEVPLKFEDFCNADGTLIMMPDNKTSKLENILPNALDFLAYRIPTERDYSMINCKIKRFSQKTAGGTIKVPVQGTTIAGFDFDVDKLYFMRNEYKAKKKQSQDNKTDNLLSQLFNQDTSELIDFEEYDFSKSPLENSRAARNNMLISLIRQRLMDEETFEQRYTPGGFANSSNAARVMRELLFGNLSGLIKDGQVNFEAINSRIVNKEKDPEPNYDPSDPMTIITYNQQNQVAGKLIGIFANQNTNHAFASLMKEFKLISPIEFAGHRYSDFLNAPNGVNVDLNVAELLSASVDAVKDPVLNFLNLNTITADSGAILARLGYTTQEIGLLLNQPIIKEACEYCFNNNTDIMTAIRELTYEIEGKITASGKTITPIKDFSVNQLAKNILNDRVMREAGGKAMDNLNYAAEQLEILKLYANISEVAQDVSQFVTSSKFTASNAVGSTFGDLYAQQMKVDNYISKFIKDSEGKSKLSVIMKVTDLIEQPINNDSQNLSMKDSDYMDSLVDNPFAYEQAMFDMNRKALQLLNKYYPYERTAYKSGRERLASLTSFSTLDADTINSIHNDMMVYLLAQQEASDFNGDIPKQGMDMSNREYYSTQFSKDLYLELQANPEMKDLAIFKYMQFEVDDETENISINIQGIGGLAPYQKDEIKESWADLQRTHPEIARDLFLYNYFKLGFTFSPHAFMNLAPFDVKNSIKVPSRDNPNRTYVEFLNDIMSDKFNIDTEHFAIQYILNHLDNKRFVLEVKSKTAKDIIKPLAYKAGQVQNSFTLDINNLKDEATIFTLGIAKADKQTIVSFKPVIKIGDDIFVAKSDNPKNFNTVLGTAITYVRVKSLGTTNKFVQYSSAFDNVLPNTATPDSFESGNTSQEAVETQPSRDTLDRESMLDLLAEEFYNADFFYDNEGHRLSKNDLKEAMRKDDVSTENLAILVEDLKTACRKNGVLMLDSEGNMLKGC